jgi:hypothetical protein
MSPAEQDAFIKKCFGLIRSSRVWEKKKIMVADPEVRIYIQ